MNVVNEQVHHSKFGAGTVVNQTENVVEVEFCEEYGLKKFVYPSAFDGHLTLCNDLLQGQVDDEQADAEKRHHEEEVQKRLEEERIAAAEQKKTTRKRASTKSTTKKVSVKAHDNIEEQEM